MSESQKRQLKVFLSHSSQDQKVARELYRQLKAEGWMNIWFIEARLLPSQDWDLEIKNALAASHAVLVLHSKKYVGKEETPYPDPTFVLEVLRRKTKKSVHIIILRLDEGELPTIQKAWEVVDYFPKQHRGTAYQKLLKSLELSQKKPGRSLNEGVTDLEPEKNLQWFPSNWEKQILENREEAEDELYDSRQPRTNQKITLNTFSRIPYLMPGSRTIGMMLIFLVFGVALINFAMSRLSGFVTLPVNSTVRTLTASSTATLGIGSTRTSLKDGMTLVYVPAGEFIMGGDIYYDEKPIHIVNLGAFWIDQTEVTNAMFALFLTEEGNRAEGGVTWLDAEDKDAHIHLEKDSWQADAGYDDHPVVEVTWYGANAYCSWAGRHLPTEAEWEKAARGVFGNIYPWGNNDPTADLLNFNNNIGDTAGAGSYPDGASPFGALDMAGNVWEWVADRYSRSYYHSSPLVNPLGPETGFFRVLRGGAWNYRETYVRSIHRNRGVPIVSHDFIGFRCASSE